MGRTRRQPPLYEVLSSPTRKLGGVGPVRPAAAPVNVPVTEPKPAAPEPPPVPVAETPDPYTRRPIAAEVAPEVEPADAAVSADHQIRISSTTVMIGIGVLIIVLAGVFVAGVKRGESTRNSQLGQWLPDDGAALADNTTQPETRPTPPAPQPKPDDSRVTPNKAPDPAKPVTPHQPDGAVDPRVPGLNYLYLGSVTQKDAVSAVNFLQRNGVQAFYVFDLKKPSGNNPPCRIYASKGFPGGALYRESEKERNELVQRVEELGKQWQREEKGPIDFRQPLWTLYKG